MGTSVSFITNMNLKKAKGFLRKLKDEDLMYHLDDDAEDC